MPEREAVVICVKNVNPGPRPIPPEATEDGYDAEKAAAEIEVPETRPGDLWKLVGNHKVKLSAGKEPLYVLRVGGVTAEA